MDNRKSMMRICTKPQNAMNRKKYSNNSSGRTGVYYIGEPYQYINRWLASIPHNNKLICLGYFFTFEEAVKVREEAEKEYYGDYLRTDDSIS